MRMSLVLDRDEPSTLAVDDQPEPTEPANEPGANDGDSNQQTYRPFHAVAMLTETWTGDDRIFMEVTWRDLPLPVMAQDWTDEMHMNAVLVGRIDRVELQGVEVHCWGVWLNTAEADHYFDLVEQGFLRGVSADLDDIEAELVIPGEVIDAQSELFAEEDEASEGDEPSEDIVIPLGGEQLRVTHARLMGMTIVPFPALQEAFIENTAVTASLFAERQWGIGNAVTGWIDCDCGEAPVRPKERSYRRAGLVARGAPDYPIQAPLAPPGAWLANPTLAELTPLTVTDEGRIYGHLAGWDSCHIGFADRCVTPPRSLTNYAHFHLGQIVTAEGDRLSVGKITFGIGHAPLSATAPAALAHYDNPKATVAAHVRAGEDEFGIWIAGGLQPGLAPETIRLMLGSDLSGDWRLIGNGLELVAALAVNVPGFHKPRASVKTFQHEGMLASLVASLPVIERAPRAELPAAVATSIIERIARSIGRTPDVRVAEASARVAKWRH